MLGDKVNRGDSEIERIDAGVDGKIVELDGDLYYRISHYDRMPPFLTAVVSSSDHWMYVSSTGGLTCGRRNPDTALFPYETDDRIHDSIAQTGPRTYLLVETDDGPCLWTPLCGDRPNESFSRNLYKSLTGHRLIFEEENQDLGLVFSYSWTTSERFGFVRTATLRNRRDRSVQLCLLDGLRNVLPAGVSRDMQSRLSTLVDAYKQTEIDRSTGAALFSLAATPSDGTEPLEQLRVAVAWCAGLAGAKHLLSEKQVGAFCAGLPLEPETKRVGQRGSFFVSAEMSIPQGSEKSWMLVADTALSATDVTTVLDGVAARSDTLAVEADIESGQRRLQELVGEADGCQISADGLVSGRHFANTLFNIMRGGTFHDGYRIPADDFLEFVSTRHAPLMDECRGMLESLPDSLTRDELLSGARKHGVDLERLALEYLPLSFSRRHGDPSRPWNDFNIDLWNPDGSGKLNYQGNWRDIFQNWEALAISYPEFLVSFISRFLNASTADGYNPYVINRDGFDWEVPDPDDPWSNIGYWGDHQVIYLLKLLEMSEACHPRRLQILLHQDLFVYADVPYRLKPYQALVENPRDSIEFDQECACRVAERVADIGSDGKLLTHSDGSVCRANLLEKLLVIVLSKLGNFVPGGGIWMNTQRPEWNDANNALAGFGLSMVTLCQLRRMLVFLEGLIEGAADSEFRISEEVLAFFRGVSDILGQSAETGLEDHHDAARRQVMDGLGSLASEYRSRIYRGFSGQRESVEKTLLLGFLSDATAQLDRTIRLNRRGDGLFHSYNLVRFTEEACAVSHLPEMLEGQVAAISSGILSSAETLHLLDALRKSSLYRSDQNSYLLYPHVQLPGFLEKNVIPEFLVEKAVVVGVELQSGRREIVERDGRGKVRFNAGFMSVSDLRAALTNRGEVAQDELEEWCESFETVFAHHAYTGRSGTMFKYEGLGCIYWHMVSKLALAVADAIEEAIAAGSDDAVLAGLAEHFKEIKEGLGLHKTPMQYGAIPLEPHSHTPAFTGAQQPGMTGQVKEDILIRFRELGVCIEQGIVSFRPFLLQREEFIRRPETPGYALCGNLNRELLEDGSLAFTLCGTPVVYCLADAAKIRVFTGKKQVDCSDGASLGRDWSRSLFLREGRISSIRVDIPKDSIAWQKEPL